MTLLIKLHNNKNGKTTNKTNNTVYKSISHYSKLFYPVPSFIENKCNCGNTGVVMDNDMNVLCNICLRIPETKMSINEELMEPNAKNVFTNSRIIWMPVGKDNEYSVHGSKVIPSSKSIISPNKLKDSFYKLMINVVNGKTESVDGTYNNKTLTIYF